MEGVDCDAKVCKRCLERICNVHAGKLAIRARVAVHTHSWQMPAKKKGKDAPVSLQCAAFNQLHTHLAVGTTSGWQVVACEPYLPCQDSELSGGVAAIQMLFASSLIALVGGGERAEDSPRRLRLWNSSTSSPVFELTFASAVLRVLMNRTRLLVVLAEATHVFELATMRLLHQLECAPNPRGVAALCSSDAGICAVWPGGHAPGWVGKLTIFDAVHGSALATVAAHHSGIACVSLTAKGHLMATASEKGTVIRVHTVPESQCVYTFRRGTMRATIQSLSFAMAAEPAGTPEEAMASTPAAAAIGNGGDEAISPEQGGSGGDGGGSGGAIVASSSSSAKLTKKNRRGPLLCVTSSTGTIHVWRCGDGEPSRSGRGAAAKGLFGRGRAAAAAERDLASVKLKNAGNSGGWCIAAIREDSAADTCSMYVVSARGEFFIYALDPSSGTCSLQDERRLTPVEIS